MSRISFVLAFVLVLGLGIPAQEPGASEAPIRATVTALATDLRFYGGSLVLLPDRANALLLGAATRKAQGPKGRSQPGFLPFVQILPLADAGAIREIPAAPGAPHPADRAFGEVVVDEARHVLHFLGGGNPKPTAEHWTLEFAEPLWKLRPGDAKESPEAFVAGMSFLDPGGESFFVFGGRGSKGPLDALRRFSFAENRWNVPERAKKQVWPSAREGGRGIRLGDGRGFIVGGLDRKKQELDEAWLYSAANNTWLPAAKLPAARVHPALVWHSGLGCAVLLGGSRGGKACAEILAYDPRLDRWTEVGRLATPIAEASALYDPAADRILLMGGTDGAADTSLPTTMIQSVVLGRGN